MTYAEITQGKTGKTAGIITYWDTKNNYGSVLQNYALQTFLKRQGVRPFLIRIDFQSPDGRLQAWGHLVKNIGPCGFVAHCWSRLLVKIWTALAHIERKERSRHFSQFVEKNLHPSAVFRSLTELEARCPNADFFIAGSDQIWNTYGDAEERIGDTIRAYLLSFVGSGAHRIACAASFGTKEFDSSFSNIFRKELARFNFVSVREQSGVDICEALEFRNAVLQPDPTMMLAASEYRSIGDDALVASVPYILLYLLGNTSDFSIRRLKAFAARHGLKVIYVPANKMRTANFHKKEYPTVQEWLGLYGGASFVVTNSFHGTVFALIYNKNFLFVPQCGKFQGQNERIHSLLEYFGLGGRIFADGNLENLMSPIAWDSVNARLKEIRERSPFVTYMKTYLSGGVE